MPKASPREGGELLLAPRGLVDSLSLGRGEFVNVFDNVRFSAAAREGTVRELRGEWVVIVVGFGLNVSLRNGSSFCLSRRERPKLVTADGRMWLTNGAMAGGLPGNGPADRGTYTFIQEVLSIGSAGAG